MSEQDIPVRRKLRRFCWWDGALWWRSYTAGGRRLACATMETAVNRPDMAAVIRAMAAKRKPRA